MKLLISGSSGFLGTEVCKTLTARGHRIHRLLRTSGQDIHTDHFVYQRDPLELQRYITTRGIEGVVHLAADYVREHRPNDIRHLVDGNIAYTAEILEACSTSVRFFIHTGTSWQNYNDADYSPVNFYAATKEATQAILQYYGEMTPLKIMTLKLFDVYGAGDLRKKLVPTLLAHSLSGLPLQLGAGAQRLNLCYVSDVADGFAAAVDYLTAASSPKLSEFALGDTQTYSLIEITKLWTEVTGLPVQAEWDARSPFKREVTQPWSSFTPLPGWQVKTSLAQGLAACYAAGDNIVNKAK